jgi:hypothetical protein
MAPDLGVCSAIQYRAARPPRIQVSGIGSETAGPEGEGASPVGRLNFREGPAISRMRAYGQIRTFCALIAVDQGAGLCCRLGGAPTADRRPNRRPPAQWGSPRTSFQNCSVEFTRGNGTSGTATSRKWQSGVQPSATSAWAEAQPLERELERQGSSPAEAGSSRHRPAGTQWYLSRSGRLRLANSFHRCDTRAVRAFRLRARSRWRLASPILSDLQAATPSARGGRVQVRPRPRTISDSATGCEPMRALWVLLCGLGLHLVLPHARNVKIAFVRARLSGPLRCDRGLDRAAPLPSILDDFSSCHWRYPLSLES